VSRENIEGWATFVWIYDEWLKTNPRHGAVVVEVGVALGKTITYIADRLIETGRTDIELWAVDPWAGNARNGEQQKLADNAGGDFTLYARMMLEHDPKAFEVVRPIRARSHIASRMFDCGSVDLVTLDGDHDYGSVSLDIAMWLPTLRNDGWIGGDDHNDHQSPGVIRACREAFGRGSDVGGTGYEVNANNRWNWPTWLKRPKT
jgi:hypothetical protein